jgi:sugar phosphate isomerase/epimerase
VKISFLMYEPVPDLAELTRRMERIAELGYHGVELVATHPLGYDVGDLVQLADRLSLPVVSLLTGWSYGAEGLCLSSPDAGVRERAVARLGDYIDHASQLRAVVVVGLMQGLRSDEPDEQKANDRIAACLQEVARKAEAAGVTIVLEPVNHLQVGFNNTAGETAAMVKRVGSRAVSYMLDTIHLNIEERSVLGTMREHVGRICHFHLCDSNGGPYGTGNLDFSAVLRTLQECNYQGYVSTKIYRKTTWEESAVATATFLSHLGVKFQAK